jgi:DNA-binding NtrC family response regulator
MDQQPQSLTNDRRIRLVLIDDDPLIGMLACAIASDMDVDIDAYESLMDLGIGRLGQYDAAIVDYDLGREINGVEIGEYLSSLFGGIPMILISGSQRQSTADHPWPPSIYGFIHKCAGWDTILATAIHAARTASRGRLGPRRSPNDRTFILDD